MRSNDTAVQALGSASLGRCSGGIVLLQQTFAAFENLILHSCLSGATRARQCRFRLLAGTEACLSLITVRQLVA